MSAWVKVIELSVVIIANVKAPIVSGEAPLFVRSKSKVFPVVPELAAMDD